MDGVTCGPCRSAICAALIVGDSAEIPQLMVTSRRISLRLAFTSLEHLLTMDSVVKAIKHTPPLAREMPSHISVEVVEPMPSVNTRKGASGLASSAALFVAATVPGVSQA